MSVYCPVHYTHAHRRVIPYIIKGIHIYTVMHARTQDAHARTLYYIFFSIIRESLCRLSLLAHIAPKPRWAFMDYSSTSGSTSLFFSR
mgnify:CR=1 FL=1